MTRTLKEPVTRRRFGATVAAAIVGLGICFGSATRADAGEARIAVAANFTDAAKEIAAAFEAATDYTAVLSFGSTGQLFTQITQGAPFDAFLAADQARPAKAVEEGLAVASSRFTYATGRLVLYSATPGLVQGPETLEDASITKIAIANPTTAPYGAGAVAAMRALDVYDAVAGKIVRGTNIAQTYQFVATGNAEVGFVALAQVAAHEDGSRWLVPEDLHAEIAQDAVLLTASADNEAAIAFLGFLRGPEAREIIARFGYGFGSMTGADG